MTALESITAWMASHGFKQTKIEPLVGDLKAHVFAHEGADFEQRFYFNADGSLAQIGTKQFSIGITEAPPVTAEQFLETAKRLASIGMMPIYLFKSDDVWVTNSAAYMTYRTYPELDSTQGHLFLLQLGFQLCDMLKSENRFYQFTDCTELTAVRNQLMGEGGCTIIHTSNGYFRDERLGDADLFIFNLLATCMTNSQVWYAVTGKRLTPTTDEHTKTRQYIDYLKDAVSIPVNKIFKGFI